MAEFLGFVTLCNGYNGRTVTVPMLCLPSGRLIHAAPYGLWTSIYSDILCDDRTKA
jgi:hypothetical protein